MKESQFNIYTDDNSIVFNTLTGALACVDESYFKVINNIKLGINNENDSLLKDIMYKNGFIVDKKCDEIKKLSELRSKQKHNKYVLNITIVPTMACNFDCPYCFETHTSEFMTDTIKDKVLEFFLKNVNLQELKIVNVTWFGGEPLLALDTIESLSTKFIDICNKKNIKFRAAIITNGYLINEKTIEVFERCKINSVQITVDGTKSQHDCRRKLKGNNKVSTYNTIMNNVNLLTSNGIAVSIRVNIDKFNHNELENIAEQFGKEILNKELTRIYLGHVFKYEETEKNNCIHCLSKKEYGQDRLKFAEYCRNKGFENALKIIHPKLKANYCASVTDNSVVIGVNGEIFKCWNDVGNSNMSIGNLSKSTSNVEYKNKDKWDQYNVDKFIECTKCVVLPLCAGGCPRESFRQGNEGNCQDIKFIIKDWMKLYVQSNDIKNKGGDVE